MGSSKRKVSDGWIRDQHFFGKYPCSLRNRLLKTAKEKCTQMLPIQNAACTNAQDGFNMKDDEDCSDEAKKMPKQKDEVETEALPKERTKQCVDRLTTAFPNCTDNATIAKTCNKRN